MGRLGIQRGEIEEGKGSGEVKTVDVALAVEIKRARDGGRQVESRWRKNVGDWRRVHHLEARTPC